MANKQIIPAEQILPPKLFILPIIGKPIFPGIFTPLIIHSNEDVNLVHQALSGDQFIGLSLTDSADTDDISSTDLFRVGTVAKIIKKINLPDGGINIFVSTLKRFKIKKFISGMAPITAAVSYLDSTNADSDEVKALTRALITEMKQISENNPLFSEEMRLNMVNIDHPGKITDFITSILNIDRLDQQKILETLDIRKRMEKVLIFIKKEQDLIRIQKKIQNQINEKISKSQREYILREELKAIKNELGLAVDARSQEYNKFKELVDKLKLKGEVKDQVESELEKFSLLESTSPEFAITRNYLETIVNLPWNPPEPREIDMEKAKKILDEDHYGLIDVKERILEYLAVRKRKQDSKGSIICLVGPPGVGKTSVGKSIARALGKKFFRFSVGGMRDEAEIKGHRRTYIGAMPGKIIQGLKIVKTADPVFMIDEIDKLGVSYQGDPSSALLEVLDPEQNVAFRDHYLDLPFDVSNILFITTANTLDTIPSPLLNRMEVIHLSGYITEEKVAIAKKYLIPKSLEKHGFKKRDITYSTEALKAIARDYAREAGLRNYEKCVDKIHRKIAKESYFSRIKFPLKIEAEGLVKYLKKPVFQFEMQKILKPGMAIGLAWTSMGGETLTIEAVANPGKEGFKLTGQMGEVMQESANIAYTYVRQIADRHGVSRDYFENNQIHLHIPAGATPKDGPSAGITMASCLLSLVTDRKIRPFLAMTGELSLVGRVLPIGGLKEKTIAAKRNKIKEIIIPHENLKDLEEIPDYIKKGIKFHPVTDMSEVVEKLFR
ncbi:MAG: endopeptidase La [Spirochaetales bacterium]|nr:endopeptidase La [Spirochaetales bacterium]